MRNEERNPETVRQWFQNIGWQDLDIHSVKLPSGCTMAIHAFSTNMAVDKMLNYHEWWLDYYNGGVECSEAKDIWAAVYGFLESWRLYYQRQREEKSR